MLHYAENSLEEHNEELKEGHDLNDIRDSNTRSFFCRFIICISALLISKN